MARGTAKEDVCLSGVSINQSAVRSDSYYAKSNSKSSSSSHLDEEEDDLFIRNDVSLRPQSDPPMFTSLLLLNYCPPLS